MKLKVANIDFAYNSHPVLSEVNFSLDRGRVMCVLGVNGAGKSTLLKCMNRILNPQRGSVLLEGEIKSIVLSQLGFDSVGIMGCKSFDPAWSTKFGKETIIALDPDAYTASWRLAKTMRSNGYKGTLKIARFPMKPDDCVHLYGATKQDVEDILQLARPA